MARQAVTVQIVAKWWLRWYLSDVMLMAAITGQPPNEERVSYWVLRGLKARAV